MMITPRLPSNFVNMLRSKSLHVYGEEWILDYEEFSDGHQDSSRSIRPYLGIFVPLPTSVTTGVTMFYIFPLSFGLGLDKYPATRKAGAALETRDHRVGGG